MRRLLITSLCFVAFSNSSAQPIAATAPASALDWAKKKCTDIGFKAGTERFGNCVLQLSRNDEAAVNSPKQVAAPEKSPPITSIPVAIKTFKDCDVCPEMVVIPAGKFLMGSKDDPFANPKPNRTEMPQHEVSLKGFSLGKFEVTQEQWYAIMGTLPSKFQGRTLPVEQVSWDDAQEFVKKLSEKTGKLYRLPSESEWEYAARGGMQTAYSFSDDTADLNSFAWFMDNSNSQPHPVGDKSPNAFGLCDMHGNVWEWVKDSWNSSYVGAPLDGSAWTVGSNNERVLRGGSWRNFPEYLRSATRNYAGANVRYSDFGFRVARDN